MDAFGVVDVEVPEHGMVRYIGAGMTFVTPVHGGELDWVSDEEYGEVIEDKVLNTLLGVELGCPAANISNCVTRTLFTPNGRNAREKLSLLANLGEKFGIRKIRDVIRDLEFTECTSGFCVNTAFRDALSCKMSQNFHSLDVAQDRQTTIGITVANLLDTSWAFAWLAYARVNYVRTFVARQLGGSALPFASVLSGLFSGEVYQGVSVLQRRWEW